MVNYLYGTEYDSWIYWWIRSGRHLGVLQSPPTRRQFHINPRTRARFPLGIYPYFFPFNREGEPEYSDDGGVGLPSGHRTSLCAAHH